MKDCLIVYYSYHHGNTEKIANAMAEISNSKICAIDRFHEDDVGECDIVGFGSGIAYGRHYDRLLETVSRLRLQGKRVFVFSTSGTGDVKYNSALIDRLKRAGASVVGSFACKGYDTFGPLRFVGGISKGHPDHDDIVSAEEFIQRLVR